MGLGLLAFALWVEQGAKAGDAPDLVALGANEGRMAEVIRRYASDRDVLGRKYPLELSPERATRMRGFTESWLKALDAMPFEPLDVDERVDWVRFRSYLVHEAKGGALDAKRQAEMAPLIPFASTLTGLEEARLRMEAVDPEKASARLTEIAAMVRKASEGLEKLSPKPSRTVANRAVNAVNGLRRATKDWFEFYDGYDPVFTWWMATSYADLDKALADYAAGVRQKMVGIDPSDKNAIIGDPIGREGLLAELDYEMIPYTPEELIQMAQKEFAWCDVEVRKASRDMGYGDDWHAAMEKVKTDHVAPGKQPQTIRDMALEAIDFVKKRDLVTIPPLAEESWRMEMLSPESQLVSPFFLGGEEILVSFPTNTMTEAQKQMSMRGNNVHFAHATVFHELIPGHHLQGFMAERYRPYRQLFYTPFLVEGWALYWELRMWDMGFHKTPEDRMGALFWRMHRCARIILSLKFHLGEMTPAECIDFLVDRVGHERANAEAEVRRWFRGDYGPLYQVGYLTGGLQLRALHHELVDSKRMTDKQFHDAVLKENTMPIEMIRASLTRTKLSKSFAPQWRFYPLP
ncbi:DUF885 family protein [soil metagenome]